MTGRATAAALLVVAFSGYAEGGPEGASPFEGSVPVEQPLTGDLPVGRWQCFALNWPLAELATSNVRPPPPGCNVELFSNASGIELRADGVAFVLGIKLRGPNEWYTYQSLDYDEDAEFEIAGVPISRFSRMKELRWAVEPAGDWKSCHESVTDTCLRITWRAHEKYALTVLSPDVLALRDTYYGTHRLLFRIGSEANRRMHGFRECVAGNKGQALFAVQDCGNPISG